MQDSVVAASIAYGEYQDWVPVYAASILIAYPDYRVKVAISGRLSRANREAVGLFAPNVEIVEDWPFPDGDQDGRTERWLLPGSFFAGFSFAWIGDIDVLVVREQPTLGEIERRRMQNAGRPHSNSVRPAPCEDRVTGCMAIAVRPYFAAMSTTQTLLRARPDLFPLHNEQRLLAMLRRASIPPDEHDRRAAGDVHGVHLGVLRQPNRRDAAWLESPKRESIMAVLSDDHFAEVRAKCNHCIRKALDELEEYIR